MWLILTDFFRVNLYPVLLLLRLLLLSSLLLLLFFLGLFFFVILSLLALRLILLLVFLLLFCAVFLAFFPTNPILFSIDLTHIFGEVFHQLSTCPVHVIEGVLVTAGATLRHQLFLSDEHACLRILTLAA